MPLFCGTDEPLEAEEGEQEDGEHGAAELVAPGKRVAKPVREGGDPLTGRVPST